MTDEHEHTEQEQTLYDHMHAGEWDQIDELRQEAYTAPPATDKDTDPDTDLATPAEQFDTDYANAYTHYQADHEAPEKAREVATKAEVSDQNATAAKAEEAM